MGTERIKGKLTRIRYENEETGFIIGTLDQATIKGSILGPSVGVKYELTGRWVDDPKYGRQFAFDDYDLHVPTDEESIREYLIEKASGVGPATAKQLTQAYGADTLEICRKDPDRVAREIKRISRPIAVAMAKALKEGIPDQDLQLELRAIFRNTPVPTRTIVRIVDTWGSDAPGKIRENPYALVGIRGIGFKSADQVAVQVGYETNGPFRIQAGLLHMLKHKSMLHGHTCTPRDELIAETAQDLGLDVALIGSQIDTLATTGDVVVDGEVVYAAALHRAEETVARQLKKLSQQIVTPGNADYRDLADDQKEALRLATTAGVFILTGAPGTGKTYTIRRIISSFPKLKVLLAAPTGKAAKRMTEMTGRSAQTIHKLLEPMRASGSEFHFQRNAENPIEADVVIIDEMSMVDIRLMASLLRAIDSQTRLILVGDTYQLPSVGPGNVLKDLIESGAVATVELTQIKRQDPGLIIRNCHRIKAGEDIELPETSDASSDFFFVHKESQPEIRDYILELVTRRIPQKFSADPIGEIQVITPLRRQGLLSCNELNPVFQARMNPSGGKMGKFQFRIGDKVIQNKNQYNLDTLNGDLGTMLEIRTKESQFVVRFENPSRTVEIPMNESELDLAYAITCHKFQGSEAPYVVIPLHQSQGGKIPQRSWLYTAISRATKMCIIVGQRQMVTSTIRRDPQGRRFSMLARRLA